MCHITKTRKLRKSASYNESKYWENKMLRHFDKFWTRKTNNLYFKLTLGLYFLMRQAFHRVLIYSWAKRSNISNDKNNTRNKNSQHLNYCWTLDVWIYLNSFFSIFLACHYLLFISINQCLSMPRTLTFRLFVIMS